MKQDLAVYSPDNPIGRFRILMLGKADSVLYHLEKNYYDTYEEAEAAVKRFAHDPLKILNRFEVVQVCGGYSPTIQVVRELV